MSEEPLTMTSLTKLIESLMKHVAKTHHIDEIEQEISARKTKVEVVETRVSTVEDKMCSLEERLRRVEQTAPRCSMRPGPSSAEQPEAQRGGERVASTHCELEGVEPACMGRHRRAKSRGTRPESCRPRSLP